MLHALNTGKILQITLLSVLACITVYTTVLIPANSETTYIVHLITILAVYHKKT